MKEPHTALVVELEAAVPGFQPLAEKAAMSVLHLKVVGDCLKWTKYSKSLPEYELGSPTVRSKPKYSAPEVTSVSSVGP